MSTPPIGNDDGSPRRLRLRRRPDPGGAARRGRPDRRTHPDGTLPQPEPILSGAVRASDTAWLRERARRDGARAAADGVFDPWVLGSADGIPYLAELASTRDRVRLRVIEEEARTDEETALAASRIRAAATAAGHRVERLTEQRNAMERRLEATTRQLDRLVQRSERWQNFRDTVRGSFERRWQRSRMPADWNEGSGPGSAPGSGRAAAPHRPADDADWQTVPDPDPAHPAAGAAMPGTAPVGGVSAAWEGLGKRPGMSDRGRNFLLAVLIAVEFPVYFAVFQNLHGTGRFADLLSYCLTAGVSVAMILVPHFASRSLRRHAATGAIRSASAAALGFMALWAYSARALGDLRAKLVFRKPDPIEVPPSLRDTPAAQVPDPPSLVDSLHLDPHSVSLMFVGLLLLSGGIAFLLGLGGEHPYVAAYRDTRDELAELDRRLAAEDLERQRGNEAEAQLTARLDARREAQAARLRAVDETYEAAAHAYLDGVAGALGDPAVTEAATRLSRRWPLLPHLDGGPAARTRVARNAG
jgi:hypothetical protein